jgi:xanthine dehydrogenase accessory factor
MNVWQAAADLARRGAGGAIATVADCRGSTPVRPGTKMLVGESDRLSGTVGGGCVEADVIAAGLDVQRSGVPRLLTHHLNADVAGDLGLSCGGTVHVFVEPVCRGETCVRVYEAAARAATVGERAVVVTGVAWGGQVPVKAFLSDRARVVTEPFAGLTAAESALASEGETRLEADNSILVEPIVTAPRLVLFGAGHVAQAVARAARAAGFRVLVIDDRAEFANAERFPDSDVLVADFRGAVQDVALEAADFVVIATRGHRQDALILERVAPSAARYVGLLGSQRKGAVVRKALLAAGIAAGALDRVRVPVGLPIGAATPEEIAVSVVAELIQERRRKA